MADSTNTNNAIATAVPVVNQPISDPNGTVNLEWWRFFVALWQRSGGHSGTLSNVLDNITSALGAMLYRGSGGWAGLLPGQGGQLMRQNASATAPAPEWAFIDGSSFAAEAANRVLAGPAAGTAAQPTFRYIASADLVSLDGQYPGSVDGSAGQSGNIGETITATIASASAIALTSATPQDIVSIALSAGDWDIWANISTSGAVTACNAWINTISATDPLPPNNGAYLQTGAQSTPITMSVGTTPLLESGPTTVYLSTTMTFGGSVSAYGSITARRRR